MMENIDWEAAINIRRSTRAYEMVPVDLHQMAALQAFINNFRIPFEHEVTVRLFKARPDKKLFTAFSAPPDGAAFISKTDIPSISRAGFVGELLVLYATGLGLSTCWYGHYSLAEMESIMPHLGPDAGYPHPRWGYGTGVVSGERAICISPLGYRQRGGLRLWDRVQESRISYRRKPIEAFIEGRTSEGELPLSLRYAFDLARKAPSGANSQHWRFGVSTDYRTVTLSMPVGYKHIKWEHPDVDIGICACHFWLALLMKRVDCVVSLHEEQGRAVWCFEL